MTKLISLGAKTLKLIIFRRMRAVILSSADILQLLQLLYTEVVSLLFTLKRVVSC